MPTPVEFQQFPEDIAHGVHNLGSHTLKLALTNTLPDVAANAVLADLTEIAEGNGYVAGGYTASVTASGQTAGVYALELGAFNILATGGSMAEWRWAVLYNDTATDGPLICSWDRGAPITLTDGASVLIEAGVWMENA